MGNDTVRNLGFGADITAVLAIVPVAYTTSSTPVLSSAIDTTSYPRARILVVASCKADATSTGVTPTVTESASSGGSYTAATTGTETFAATNSATTQMVSVRRNPAKPFLKVTLTPAGGSGVFGAEVLFINPSV